MGTSLNTMTSKTRSRKSQAYVATKPGSGAFMEYTIPDLAIILSLVYLGAGLPPEPALRAALADYIHSFSGKKQGSL